MALSNESADLTSGFAGVEFEETFPEPTAPSDPAPARGEPETPTPRLTVVRDEPAPRDEGAPHVEPAPRAEPPRAETRRREPASDQGEARLQDKLTRLREAEALVKQTIESVRREEGQRLAEWIRTRREEEERRIAKWAEERRAAIERSIEVKGTSADGVAQRVEDMLYEWQERFEQRLDERRLDDERRAERQRIIDEERLRAWRGELEHALSERVSRRDRRSSDRTSGVRASTRDAIAQCETVRDVGRVLRDVFAEVTPTSALALALHHDRGDDVAYRYRVASEDEVGAVLRGETLDDGPRSAASHAHGWSRAQRTLRAGERNVTVHIAQLAIRSGSATIGVLTLQSEQSLADTALGRTAEIASAAAPRLAELRDAGAFSGA